MLVKRLRHRQKRNWNRSLHRAGAVFWRNPCEVMISSNMKSKERVIRQCGACPWRSKCPAASDPINPLLPVTRTFFVFTDSSSGAVRPIASFASASFFRSWACRRELLSHYPSAALFDNSWRRIGSREAIQVIDNAAVPNAADLGN